MRKLIAAMNMTIDGFCDHTAMIADEEIHEHYNDLLRNTGMLIYGRITYQLMESYWPAVVKNPTGDKASNEFALAIQDVPKIVFSKTLKEVAWENTTLFSAIDPEEIKKWKNLSTGSGPTGDMVIFGSGTIVQEMARLGLIDEYRLMVNPVILGKGKPMFKDVPMSTLTLLNTRTFGNGNVLLYYEPRK